VSLTAADVAEIMKILEGSSFDEVMLEIDGLKLSMRRGAATDGAAAPSVNSSPAPSANTSATPGPAARAAAAAPQPATSAGAAISAPEPGVQDVTSPLLGTCYRAPKPGAPPFVEVGSSVNEDTVVAIVEVMKLMNTVRAGVRGTVTEILMRDGALVEYGETLLRIRKAG
jgi:acetyl-CoA carboxylase biotin carboxyl carrier protein